MFRWRQCLLRGFSVFTKKKIIVTLSEEELETFPRWTILLHMFMASKTEHNPRFNDD